MGRWETSTGMQPQTFPRTVQSPILTTHNKIVHAFIYFIFFMSVTTEYAEGNQDGIRK